VNEVEWPPFGEVHAVAGVSPGGASFELWQGLPPGNA
jgi:hypothetical protein